MSRWQGITVWLILVMIAGLFYLSISSPRGWERVARPAAFDASTQSVAPPPEIVWQTIAPKPAPEPAKPVDEVREAPPVWTLATLENAETVLTRPERTVSHRPRRDLPRGEIEIIQQPAPSAPPSGPEALEEPVDPEAPPAPAPAIESPKPEIPLPSDLEKRIDRLARECSTARWAEMVRSGLRRFFNGDDFERSEAAVELDSLTTAASDVARNAPYEFASDVRRVAHTAVRYVTTWQLSEALANASYEITPDNYRRLSLAIEQVEAKLSNISHADDWRAYLRLDDLRDVAHRRPMEGSASEVTAEVLLRLAPANFTLRQRRFLSDPAFAELADALRPWSARSLRREELFAQLNEFERSGLPSDAHILASSALRLNLSNTAEVKEVGRFLDEAYRNANLRVAITADFLNRVLPEQPIEEEPVHDSVLGVMAHGRRQTATDLRVRLIPDSRRLLLTLQAAGHVAAWTRSSSGPATFASRSDSLFTLHKPFEIRLTGIRSWPAQGSAVSATKLRALETDFDAVPVVGLLVGGIARSQYISKQDEAAREIERKVARQAEERIETETGKRIAELNEKLHKRFLLPMDRIGLAPTPVEMQTTEERMVVRLRVAHDQQLGGHTPRPAAPADSILSLQIHQSLLNNIVEQLALDGRSFTLAELDAHLQERLNVHIQDSDEQPRDLRITFAERDAVRITCEEGRVTVEIAIAEMRRDRDRWRNFTARAYYVPKYDGLNAWLERDGIVQIRGRIPFRGQFAVRGVFAMVFPADEPLQLTPQALLERESMRDQQVNQFVIDDGWIGLAVGPAPKVTRDRLARDGAANAHARR